MAIHPLGLTDIAKAKASGKRVTLNFGSELAGCALEIQVRKNSEIGYFRYNGTGFGEKRVERLRLGTVAELGLPELRRRRVACEQLIEEGTTSPKQHRSQQQKQVRQQHTLAKRTLRGAMDEFFAWAGGND